MPDEVLRLRTTIETGQGLADLRKLQQMLAETNRNQVRGAREATEAYKGLNVAFGKFEQQVRSVTNFFRAGVVATAARQLVSAMNDVARTAVNLHHMSQELGFSEQQLRGFSRAAERVGVPGSQMLQGLTNFAH